MNTTGADILVERHSRHVAIITMARTAKRNSFHSDMMKALTEALDNLASDGTRCAVLRAEPGARVWCAGYDIVELPRENPTDWSNPLEEMFGIVRSAPFPLIAAVEGDVYGGGCDLALSCDMIVATRPSVFAITPAKLGVAYSPNGISQFMAALPRQVVAEMFYTSEPISVERLHQLGAINRLVADEAELTCAVLGLAETIALRAPLTNKATKADIVAIVRPTDEALSRADGARSWAWGSADYLEGLAAFEARRNPEFKGV